MTLLLFRGTALLLALLAGLARLHAQTTPTDGDWKKPLQTLKNTAEADVMVRVGDIDNLGFGFVEGYNPFSGKSTEAHPFPWEPNPADVPGLDRILLGSGFGKKPVNCGGDGYSGQGRANTQPVAVRLPLDALAGTDVKTATLTLFVDDFQSPQFCSKFVATLNGRRFPDLEKILAVLDQTGPVGKFITVRLPDELLPLLKEPALALLIDDPTTGAADGCAIDFVKLLVNPKPLIYKGGVAGRVLVKDAETPVANATVRVRGYGEVTTDAGGNFRLATLPVGLNVLEASAAGYATGREVADVADGEETEGKVIFLEKSKAVTFDNRQLKEGEAVAMYNIQFRQGSAELLPTATAELEKIYGLLRDNPVAEIELSGHTSNEGERSANLRLSKERANACRQFLVKKGIDEGRIATAGYGPDRPMAPNDSEPNRAKNRRVELRMLRVQ